MKAMVGSFFFLGLEKTITYRPSSHNGKADALSCEGAYANDSKGAEEEPPCILKPHHCLSGSLLICYDHIFYPTK